MNECVTIKKYVQREKTFNASSQLAHFWITTDIDVVENIFPVIL